MQYPRQQTELNLAECRQQLRKLAVSIDVVEQHIERVQHRLEHTQVWLRADETSASQQDIDQYQDLNQEQTVQHLWHELSRLGQKEDRLRQEKVITVQLELTLSEALLQLQSPRGRPRPAQLSFGRLNVVVHELLTPKVFLQTFCTTSKKAGV